MTLLWELSANASRRPRGSTGSRRGREKTRDRVRTLVWLALQHEVRRIQLDHRDLRSQRPHLGYRSSAHQSVTTARDVDRRASPSRPSPEAATCPRVGA